jgi:hypothetical protein
MKKRSLIRFSVLASVVATLVFGLVAVKEASGQFGFGFQFIPGTLVVTRSTYVGNAETVTVGENLPPNCVAQTVTLPTISGGTTTAAVTCGVGSDNGEFPNTHDSHNVWNNANSDGNFGVTSPIFLDNVTDDGFLLDTLPVPTNEVVTSFSSKSELALHRSSDGHSLTFIAYHGGMGFQTAPNLLDVSSSNTPGLIDPTNPTPSQYYRAVVEVNSHGQMFRTDGNAYSGDNGRSVMKGDNGFYYMAGNDNNGNLSKTQLGGGSNPGSATQVGLDLVNSTGAEFLVPGQTPPVAPNIEMVGKFGVTQVGYTTADKPGKDTNYRGLLIYNNTLYVTKGSGGNGINTVYQVGAQGTLPTGTQAQLLAEPTTILPGFPTVEASGTTQSGGTAAVSFPFGIWFADPSTLYVCDEGDGTMVAPHTVNGQPNVADAASLATAGVQKWKLINGTWTMLYVLQNGLNIGVQYSVPNYPASLNPAVGGCRNMTGRHNFDGTVTLYAITSTLSTNGDQGADPNAVVKVTDKLDATSLPPTSAPTPWGFFQPWGHFSTVRAPKAGDVYRGVAFAPTDFNFDDHGPGFFGFGFGGFGQH